MKKFHLFKIMLIAILLTAFAAGSSLHAIDGKPLYGFSQLKDNTPSKATGVQTIKLSQGIVYQVSENTTIGQNASNGARTIELDGDTAIIHINANCTLTVRGFGQYPAIHVPSGKVLIISGDPGSRLVAYGGDSYQGSVGEKGKDGDPNAGLVGKDNCSGAGGKGGSGGTGSGAAIGGSGGAGGVGGNGGQKACVPHDNMNDNGRDGGGAQIGKQGEGMGHVYVIGDVHVEAYAGNQAVSNSKKASCGSGYSNGGFIVKHVFGSGGGGGGTGHSGEVGDAIGGGGGGGGAGGGGGSGTIMNSGNFSSSKYWAYGQGGRGGYNRDHSNRAVNGEMESCQTTNGTFHSGHGGEGSDSGKNGDAGTLAAKTASAISLSPARSKGKEITPIDANHALMRMKRYYTGVDRAVEYEPKSFYYGETMPAKISVPTSTTTMRFAGFYLNDTQVYDAEGKLTKAGERTLYSYSNVQLDARWVGPAHAHVVLRYEKLNQQWDTISFDTTYIQAKVTDSVHLVFHPQDYCYEGYELQSGHDIDRYLHYGDTLREEASYKLKQGQITWQIPNAPASLYEHIWMKDGNNRSKSLTQNVHYWEYLTQPTLLFDTDTIRLRTRVNGWDGLPVGSVMRQLSATATLRVSPLKHGMFIDNPYHTGGVANVLDPVSNGSVDSCMYAQALRLRLYPELGYRALTPQVNQWQKDTLGTAVVLTRVNETTYTFFGDSTDIVITPHFERENYHMTVDYTIVGQRPEDTTLVTYVATSEDHYKNITRAEEAVFHYDEYVSMAAWFTQDSVYEWMGEPVVISTRTGDTIPAEWSFEQVSKDGTNGDYYLCYTFRAPASDVTVHMTMFHRPNHRCTIFNYTDSMQIDSMLVNLNTVTIPQDSVIHVRAWDLLTLSVTADSAAVRAGYWDEGGIYHRIPTRVDAELLPTGDIKMCYYSVWGQPADMAMGLVDGLKIRLMYCDSVVNWLAPSAALEGDTISYRVQVNDPRTIVELDSVVFYTVDDRVMYCAHGDTAWSGQFVMPDSSLFVYVYAHKVGDYHTVTYLNCNGDTLQYSDWHQVGDTVRYNGETPIRPSDSDDYRWQFNDWTPALHAVEGDDVYTATYRRYVLLDEAVDNEPVVTTYVDQSVGVDMVRKVTTPYYSMVSFPFEMSRRQLQQIWGRGTTVWALDHTDLNGTQMNVHFYRCTADKLQAGYPYILMPAVNNDSIVLDSVVFSTRQDTVRTEHLEFRPNTLNPFWMPDGDGHYRFPIKNKMYYPGHSSGPYRALRAYFYLLAEANTATNVNVIFEGLNTLELFDSDGFADPYEEEKQGDIPTSMAPADGSPSISDVEKLLMDNHVFIRVDGRIYDILGQRVK